MVYQIVGVAVRESEMKLLRDRRAWVLWCRREFGLPLPDSEQPDLYPCYAYSVVVSYGMEESKPIYLYRSDLVEMLEKLKLKKK